jgi:hypothetical protein
MPLHRFAEVPDVDGLKIPLPVARSLFIDGVPDEFDPPLYEVRSALSVFGSSSPDPVIVFGTAREPQLIGVESKSGHVVQVVNLQKDYRGFINSDLSLFTRSVTEFNSRFSDRLASDELTEDQSQEISRQLAQMVREIDQAAFDADGFWRTLVDDYYMGP